MIPRKLFWSIITIYLILGFYIFYVSFQSPIIGIELEEKNDKWVITSYEYPIVEEKYSIEHGDIVLKVNDLDIDNSFKLQLDQTIRSASNMTIKTKEGVERHIKFSHYDLPSQFFHYFLLPLAYYFIALFLAIYLYGLNKKNKLSLSCLIVLILSVALAYGCNALSIRMDRIGTIITSTSMILCNVLFLCFLKYYLNYLRIDFKFFKYTKWFFAFPIIVLILTIFEGFILPLYSINTMIILFLFFILIVMNIVVTIVAYVKYPISQIKIILWGILLPFAPFIFLYVLPMLLVQDYILSSSISSIFFLFLPAGFVFTQLTERLFDIEYHITRLRYYSLFAFFITVGLSSGIYFFTSIVIENMIGIGLFIFISLLVSFYIKEKFDYKYRKVLFSAHGDYVHLLYKTIKDIGNSTNTNELFNKLTTIVSKQLEFDVVYIVGYNMTQKQFITYQEVKEPLHQSIDLTIFDNMQLRDIKKLESCYIACIHQDMEVKQLLILVDRRITVLKNEELLWLELVILFVNNFIDNTKLVEDLLDELNAAQQKENNQPNWLQKLIWLTLEEEKSQLARELHDTILQEQIFLIREIDEMLNERNVNVLQERIVGVHHQLLSINHQLRSYCEVLKPPLLDTLGLDAALNKLFMESKKRATFSIIHSIDYLDTKNEGWPLLIYRVIQEMLSNAVKHSEATYVKIQLKNCQNGFELLYMDNGVGCDIDSINESEKMGITGMRERILAFNGIIEIDTYPNEGMRINIKVGVE